MDTTDDSIQNDGSTTASNNSSQGAIEGMENLYRDTEQREARLSTQKSMQEEEISFYSMSENEHGDDNIWGLLSGVGGNIYEWYDFAVYGLLAPEIGGSFFPKSSKELQLINSFGVYLAAFLMRPLGAIFFGEIGDRLVGRKNALAFSIILITVPSVLMGLLPTYDMIGITAPILLVILRMMQGLSVGGQLAGSYVLSIEQSSSSNRGFRGSICDASSVGGFMLASAVTTVTRNFLSDEAIDDWGWRIPFWFSLCLAPLLYHIVTHTEESKFWAERAEQKEAEQLIRESEHAERPAVVDLLSSPFRRRQLAGMVGVLASTTSSFYIVFLWTPVYLSELREIMSGREADLMNFFIVGIYIALVIVCGKLSDMFPHRNDLIRIGLPALAVSCPTMFGMFESESYWGYFFAQLQFIACLALVEGGKASWEVELWMSDPTLSFTGVAIGHNLSATLFGGTMPLIATFLYFRSEQLTGDDEYALFPRLIPGLYVSLLAALALLCISFMVKHPHDVRTGELDSKLRAAIKLENQKFKEAKKKRKKRKAVEEQFGGDNAGLDPWTSPQTSFVGQTSVQGAAGEQSSTYVPPVV